MEEIRKNTKKVILLLILIFLFTIIYDNFMIKVNASYDVEKIICDATLEDDFAEDKVLLVLNEKASLIDKKYSKFDFTAFECEEVLELNGNETNNLTVDFKRVLCLKLKNSSKSHVLEVIDELIKRVQ